MTEFKISSTGLDTTSIKISPGEDIYCSEFNYVYTSISANNDYFISDFLLRSDLTGGVIVGVDFLDNIKEVLTSHLELVSYQLQAATLLLDSKLVTPDQDFSALLELTKEDLVYEIGIMNPTSPKQIELLSEKFGGVKIAEIGIDLCPLNFDLEIINYCQENNIKIIGFNPYGGYINGPAVIEAFSCPYLLGFSATHCDTVIVSGRDLILAEEARVFLESLKHQESSSKFTLRKSVHKLNKPLKTLIRTSVTTLSDAVLLPYVSPETLYDYSDLVFNFIDSKKDQVKGALILPEPGSIVRTEDEISTLEFINDLVFPVDADVSVQFSYLRYKVIPYLTEVLYPESEGWTIGCIRIGDRALGMRMIKTEKIKSGKWWSRKETKNETWVTAILALPEIGTPVFFESGRS